jgi:nicotinamide mononucleotide adenylyltransferase
MVDPWEAMQQEYMPTALVLDHFDREINTVLGGAVLPDGSRRKIQIILLAGAGEAQYSLFWIDL